MNLWIANLDSGFDYNRLGDIIVCYNHATGLSHLLNEMPLQVLLTLKEGPLSFGDIRSNLEKALLDDGDDLSLVHSLPAILEQLQNEELVFCQTC